MKRSVASLLQEKEKVLARGHGSGSCSHRYCCGLLHGCSCCWCSSAFTSRAVGCFTPACAARFIPVTCDFSFVLQLQLRGLLESSYCLTDWREGEGGMSVLLQLSPHSSCAACLQTPCLLLPGPAGVVGTRLSCIDRSLSTPLSGRALLQVLQASTEALECSSGRRLQKMG